MGSIFRIVGFVLQALGLARDVYDEVSREKRKEQDKKKKAK